MDVVYNLGFHCWGKISCLGDPPELRADFLEQEEFINLQT